jgi:hypothetical protein
MHRLSAYYEVTGAARDGGRGLKSLPPPQGRTKNMDNRLELALRTLRAIRQRYEMESAAGSGGRSSYTVHVALGYTDMRWIDATIEALEEATQSNS